MSKAHSRFVKIGGGERIIGHAIQANPFPPDVQQIIDRCNPPGSELFGSSESFTDFQREHLRQAGFVTMYLLGVSGRQLYTSGSQWFTADNHKQLAVTLSATAHHGEIAIPPSPFLPHSQGKPLGEQLQMLNDYVDKLHIPGIQGYRGNPIDYIQVNEAYKEVIGDDFINLYSPNLPFIRTSTLFGDNKELEIIGGRVTPFFQFIINSISAGTAAGGVALAPIIAPARLQIY